MPPVNVVKTSANISVIDNTAISNDSKLSGLIISSVSQNGETKNLSYSPSFSPDVFEYAADVGSNINRIIVATTLSDSHSTASVSGSRIDLGNNKTTITVTAQDGSTRTYTITITRKDDRTGDTSLKSLKSSSEALESRAPVGSSARMILGSVISALATAALCFWPPDTS